MARDVAVVEKKTSGWSASEKALIVEAMRLIMQKKSA
jgi:hypothetical protein